jgi:hypothetical protein
VLACCVLAVCGVLAVLELTELVSVGSCGRGLEVELRIGTFGVSLTAAEVSWSVGYYTPYNSLEPVILSPLV